MLHVLGRFCVVNLLQAGEAHSTESSSIGAASQGDEPHPVSRPYLKYYSNSDSQLAALAQSVSGLGTQSGEERQQVGSSGGEKVQKEARKRD